MPRTSRPAGRKLPAQTSLAADHALPEQADTPAPVSTVALPGLALAAGPQLSQPPSSAPVLTALRRHGEMIRRRTIELEDGTSIETDRLKAKELRRLQKLHPGSAESIQAALDAGEFRTSRVRPKNNLSDGESEEDEAVYNPSQRSYFRSLREEEQPEISGLLPPVGHDPSITARAHVIAGTKAKVKSKYVSASHSMRVSGAWGASDGSRIAKFQAPETSDFYDLMDVGDQQRVGLTGTGLNAAKGSQEVLIGDGVPPEYVQAIYTAERMKVAQYKSEGGPGATDSEARFRSRTVATGTPYPVKMTKVYDREKASEERLQSARDHWETEIADTVEQVNAQFGDREHFEPVDEHDVTEYVTDYLTEARVDDPYRLDYISNDSEYNQYIAIIDAAIQVYIDSFR